MKKVKILKQHKRFTFGILLALILLAVSGTIAYNFNTAIFDNSFKLKYGENTSTETFTSPENWKTCDETPKTVVTSNDGNFNIRVRLSYSEYWKAKDGETTLPLTRDGVRLTTINFQNENDWEDGGDGWYYWKGELAPGESTRSLFKSVTYNCGTGYPIQNICHDTPTGTVCEQPENEYEEARYHVFVTVQTTDIEGEFPEDQYYNVSINPNGGTYNNSSETYTARVRKNTTIDLSSVSYTDHELRDWTKNESDTFTGSAILVTEDINLVANWLANIFHNVTVDPNGGTYDGKTTISTYEIREGSNYTILDATRDTYALEGWTYSDDTAVDGNIIRNIADDISIKAVWAPAVARIESTGKLYSSIMKAEAEAQNGDTITLLVDTTETVTNEKTVTLDLGTHIVTGSLTNTATGNITLINGEINNPAGAAVTNNGTLTLGYDDYLDTGKANIINEYVRLIGTAEGLKQNGTFNYYDGILEGDIALNGGYNSAPYYHNVEDQTTIYYYPYITHIDARDCQHAELASADNSVSKTTVGGDIYYLNLQDNINTSAATGYKIYAVRDFNATYPLTVAAGTEIEFDIAGYEVMFADTMVNNGKITISNSEDTGKISNSQTIVNNGNFIISGAEVMGTTSNDTITNNATVTMRSGTLSANTGYVVRPKNNTTFDLDDDSYIKSYSSTAAVYINSGITFEFSNGTITGKNMAVTGDWHNTFNMTGGEIKLERETSDTLYGYYANTDCYVNLSGDSKIVIKNTASNGGAQGIGGRPIITMKDNASISIESNNSGSGISGATDTSLQDNVTITINNTNSATGVYSRNYHIAADSNVKVTVVSSNSSATGFYSEYLEDNMPSTNIDSGIITVESNGSGNAIGLGNEKGPIYVRGGTIDVTAKGSGTAFGIRGWRSYYKNWGSFNISGGNITATSNTGSSFGLYTNGDNNPQMYTGDSSTNISGGTITASSTNGGTSYGAYTPSGHNNITGGTISGGTYGIYAEGRTVTIGTDEGDQPSITSPEIIGGNYGIYSGNYNFYDGVIRGGTNAYDTGIIKAMPDGTIRHHERDLGPEDDPDTPENERTGRESCWLVDAENYLEVDGVEYNSLKKAYDAITGDSGTIKVIADIRVETNLPTSPSDKEITFDLNGHELIYLQSLTTAGTFNLVDSSQAGTGVLYNPNTYAVVNAGTLNIKSGTYNSGSITIYNNSERTINMSGGTITAPYMAVNGGWRNTFNMTGGEIKLERETSDTLYGYYANTDCYVNLSGDSKITIKNTASNGGAQGIGGYPVTVIKDNASITIDSNNSGYGVGGSKDITLEDNASITVNTANGGTAVNGYQMSFHIPADTNVQITAISSNASATGFYSEYNADNYPSSNIDSGIITVESNGSGYAIGVGYERGHVYINGGTINATAKDSGTAYGVYAWRSYYKGWGSHNVSGGTITATSNTGSSFGLYTNGDNNPQMYTGDSSTNISGGTITASSTNGGTSYGAYTPSGHNNITGGTISGGTYGIYAEGRTVTIGTDEGDQPSITSPEIIGGNYGIYSGNYNFYDGVIRGGTNAYDTGIIKAMPDGTIRHHERDLGPEDDPDTPENERTGRESCWLVDAENYLEVDGVEYNSLKKAYDAITGDSGTIKVIADIRVETNLPTSPSDKEITFDLNGHELIYLQSLTTAGTFNLVDSSQAGTGVLYNPNTYAVVNAGTLNIKSGTYNSGSITIYNNSERTINMSGGTITAPYMAVNGGWRNTFNMTGGEIKLERETSDTLYGYYANTDCYVNLSGDSKITIKNTASNGGAQGIGGYPVTVIKDNASITIDSNNSGYGVGGSKDITLEDNASITVNTANGGTAVNGYQMSFHIPADTNVQITAISSNASATGFYSEYNADNYPSSNIDSGIITVESNGSGSAIGVGNERGHIYINGGTITSTSKGSGTAFGTYAYRSYYKGWGSINVTDGSITATSNTGGSYGIYVSGYNSPTQYTGDSSTNVSGGTITASSTNGGTSYGAYTPSGHNNITGGTISGGTYGIYAEGRTVTIGTDEGDQPSITSPEIIGGNYGIYSGNYNFYDGIIKGGIDPYQTVDMISAIADGTTVVYDTDIIDDETYQTSYLIPEYDCVKIGSTKYKHLNRAIAAAETGDTIELIADNYIFENIIIPTDKDITIETAGYNIVTSHPFTNNGKTKIINSNTTSTPVFNYRGSQYYFTNTADAELELKNISVKSANGISNASTLKLTSASIESTGTSLLNSGSATFDGVTLTSSDVAISNTGTIQSNTNDNSTITGTNYAIYTSGGTITLSNTTLVSSNPLYHNSATTTTITSSTLTNNVTNNGGSITIIDSTVSKTGTNLKNFIANNDEMTFRNTNISFNSSNTNYEYYDTSSTAIVNRGKLTFDSTDFELNYSAGLTKTVYAIDNGNSELNITGSNITTKLTDVTSDSNTQYGIYNNAGIVNFYSGSLIMTRNTSYGIYNETGEITIGQAESSSDPDYGLPTANVSITNPNIRAIGSSTGIGVKNGTGRVNFYDGIITGSTHPMPDMPDIPTKTEYHFEARSQTDGDGYQSVILKYIQSN